MLITLTGFMGSGKSTVGRIIADALGCPFMDMDSLIEKKVGKSIPEIFATDGEAHFRLLEKQLLEQTVKKYAGVDAVLALGGGTAALTGAAALLREKTLCIYLQDSLENLRPRLVQAQRPLAGEDLEALLALREPFYMEAASIVLPTAGHSPEEIADEIIISCL